MLRKKQFWEHVSNYSIIVVGLMIISKQFFRKYLESIIDEIMLAGLIACILFPIAEFMKFRFVYDKELFTIDTIFNS